MKIKIGSLMLGLMAIIAIQTASANPTGSPSGANTGYETPPLYLKLGLPPAEVERQRIVIDEIDGKKRITTWKKMVTDPNDSGSAGNGVWYPITSIEPAEDASGNLAVQTGVDVGQNTSAPAAKPAPARSFSQPEPSAAPSSSNY
jgi:hypothetical protein